MKYLISFLLFILAVIIFFIFNIQGLIIWETFLIFLILLYLIVKDSKIYYTFALLAGLFIDSFTAFWGLHAFLFCLIIFIINILKEEFLGRKNIFTILLLIAFAFLFYYLFTYLFYELIGQGEYFFHTYHLFYIIKSLIINILITIILYLIHYNFQKDERSF